MTTWAGRGMIDCKGPKDCEITVLQHGDTLRLWINIDGECAFRAYDVPKIIVDLPGIDTTLEPLREDTHD
jgi:hypothetical protein